MTNPYIQKRLDRLEQNRLIGKPGLSIDQVRDSQVKVRFTEHESDLLALVSQKLGQPKAVLSNVLLIDAIIDLLSTDEQLCSEVMAAWSEQSLPSLDFFSEIHARAPRPEEPIEGEYCLVKPSVSLMLENK
ncbi:hypothetical protein A1OO_08775 [Enterovibrio norvegicus FF-33]|uniref:hypothetical protein n=1 Tax=Enterovibrio norvegicus TaxID=188144 RepID=UPI00030A6BC7|nr:hypothetical protein [Enterovibrio norvegicus]OEE65892.1 hypothetical protein A1OO_08775 [Enterovibrio norvegicus FF-33]